MLTDIPQDADGRELKIGDLVELLDFRVDQGVYRGTGMGAGLEKFIGRTGHIERLGHNTNSTGYPCWVFHFQNASNLPAVGPHQANPSQFYFATSNCRRVGQGLKDLVQRYRGGG